MNGQAEFRYDSFTSFEAGMNESVDPLILPKNQAFRLVNATVRGSFPKPRPVWRRLTFNINSDFSASDLNAYFQGAAFFNPDFGDESLLASIAGRMFSFVPNVAGTSAVVTECSTPAIRQSATAPQCWIWQSEKWAIWNDGVSNPVFWDGTTAVRSTYGASLQYTTTVAVAFVVPAIGVNVDVTLTAVVDLAVGDYVRVYGVGRFLVLAIVGPVATLLNVNASLEGLEVAALTDVFWKHPSAQLPPGRMGTYGMGRNWMSLVDGKQFIASDLVGGSSGTNVAPDYNNFRDAVLNVTENAYLAGGGNFSVPGQIGDIKAMRFTATLDASLGQGPLQVLTPNAVFSCNAPVDRLTWQDLQNPILTQSLITNGGLSQNSTVLANGDLLFRSKDGVRSLILARRDFLTPGNVPISREVEPIIARDAAGLLAYGSAVVFDNRLLMTVSPANSDYGVYHRGLIALNFDPLSNLRGKMPSVYDGLWTGQNILQIVTGEFDDAERCFAFVHNTTTLELELWELLKSDSSEIRDYTDYDVIWEVQSPAVFKQDPRDRKLLRLLDGELMVSDMRGEVQFQVFYKPDWYPCWQPWAAWTDCALEPTGTVDTENYQPGFRPRVGLGEPNPTACDGFTDRPFREGHHFQIRVKIQGHCILNGGSFKAAVVPQEQFAPKICDSTCDT